MVCACDAQKIDTKEKAKAEADRVTDMLCSVMETLEKDGATTHLREDVLAWWEEHKAWDKYRMAQAA